MILMMYSVAGLRPEERDSYHIVELLVLFVILVTNTIYSVAMLFKVKMDQFTSAYQIWWHSFGRRGVVG